MGEEERYFEEDGFHDLMLYCFKFFQNFINLFNHNCSIPFDPWVIIKSSNHEIF